MLCGVDVGECRWCVGEERRRCECRRVRGGRVSTGVRRGEAGVGGVSVDGCEAGSAGSVDGCEVGECRQCRRRQHVSTMLVASTRK